MSITLLIYIYVFIIGNVVGSFLNVCIYRIPRGESVVSPPSHCPNCGYKIRWYDNIPIISYFLLLRGRCRQCKNKISIRYPIVEILTGFIWLSIFVRYQISIDSLNYIIMATILIVISYIDINEYYIPNRLSFMLFILGVLTSFIPGGITPEQSFVGAAVYGLPFLIIYIFGEEVLKKEIMGFGDVKLGMGIGAFVGYSSYLKFHIFFTTAFVLGAIISLLLIILKIKDRKSLIPFGPFISIAGFITALFLK